MPEGDSVLLVARRLHEAFASERFTRTDFRVPAFATADLAGQTVDEVVSKGKHLLLRTGSGVTLHSHLKMDGAWHVYQHGERWRGPGHQARVVLETQAKVAVGFRLGIVELLRTNQEDAVMGHLGPDVLGKDWDLAEVVRRLGQDLSRPLGEALIDQRVMAGPGNIYKCEVCFLRGVDPWLPIGEVGDLAAVVDLMKRLMEANRHTGAQVTTGDRRRGRERWVYGRRGRPCRRCGTTILRAEQGQSTEERVTYWCPSCQRGPGPRPEPGPTLRRA